MPTYRNICLNFSSDTADNIVEFAPPASLTATPPKMLDVPSKNAANSTTPFNPQLHNEARAIVSVYIPFVPKTLFWINYAVTPSPAELGIFYVFKLFVNRMEVVTWCCGHEQRFRGKCMFGLYDTSGDGAESAQSGFGKGMEKRVFRFDDSEYRSVGDHASDKDADRIIEVRVCRANRMIRIHPDVTAYKPAEMKKGHIQYAALEGNSDHVRMETLTADRLTNAGCLHAKAPQRYYKFSLIDPKDQPYATFRFYYRTWAEIEALDLRLGTVEGDNTSIFTTDTDLLDNGDEAKPVRQASANPPTAGGPSARSSISQEYFSQYPAANVALRDERNLVPQDPTQRKVVGTAPPSSHPPSHEAVRTYKPRSIGYPSISLAQRSTTTLPSTSNYTFSAYYHGNAFAQQQALADFTQQQALAALMQHQHSSPLSQAATLSIHPAPGGYPFLPPGHPHSTQPFASPPACQPSAAATDQPSRLTRQFKRLSLTSPPKRQPSAPAPSPVGRDAPSRQQPSPTRRGRRTPLQAGDRDDSDESLPPPRRVGGVENEKPKAGFIGRLGSAFRKG